MRKEIRRELKKGPRTIDQLLKRLGVWNQIVATMRTMNDEGEAPPVLCARGKRNGLRTCVYWIPPKRYGARWLREFEKLGVEDPRNQGDVL